MILAAVSWAAGTDSASSIVLSSGRVIESVAKVEAAAPDGSSLVVTAETSGPSPQRLKVGLRRDQTGDYKVSEIHVLRQDGSSPGGSRPAEAAPFKIEDSSLSTSSDGSSLILRLKREGPRSESGESPMSAVLVVGLAATSRGNSQPEVDRQARLKSVSLGEKMGALLMDSRGPDDLDARAGDVVSGRSGGDRAQRRHGAGLQKSDSGRSVVHEKEAARGDFDGGVEAFPRYFPERRDMEVNLYTGFSAAVGTAGDVSAQALRAAQVLPPLPDETRPMALAKKVICFLSGNQEASTSDLQPTETSSSGPSDMVVVHGLESAAQYESVFHERPQVDPTPSNPFYVSLIFKNDKRFGYEQLTGKKSDDTGRTHGSELHVGSRDREGVTRDLGVASDLYTERLRNVFDANGRPVKKPQHFQEVNTLQLVQDNVKRGETVYYRAGVGVVMVVSDKPTMLGAAAQQKEWHKLLGKTVYTNVGDGEKDRWGLSALGALGLQKKMETKSVNAGIGTVFYQVRNSVEAGVRGDTVLERTAYGKALAGIGFGPESGLGERLIELAASFEQGKAQTTKVEMALNVRKCSVFLVYNFYRNDLKKYAPLNEGTMDFGTKCEF